MRPQNLPSQATKINLGTPHSPPPTLLGSGQAQIQTQSPHSSKPGTAPPLPREVRGGGGRGSQLLWRRLTPTPAHLLQFLGLPLPDPLPPSRVRARHGAGPGSTRHSTRYCCQLWLRVLTWGMGTGSPPPPLRRAAGMKGLHKSQSLHSFAVLNLGPC